MCSATSVPLTGNDVAGSGTITYQWQRSTNGTTFIDIAGTGRDFTTPTLTVDTWYRRNAYSTLNTVPCQLASNDVRVTVNNVTSGAIGTAQTICSGGIPAELTVTSVAAGDGTLTYQWQSSTDGTSFSNIALATAATYTSVALTADTWFRRVVTSTITGDPITCTATSNSIKITVIPGPNITSQPTSPAAISAGGTTANMTLTATGGTPSLSYQWQYNSDPGVGTTWTNVINGTPAGSTYTGRTGNSMSVAGITATGTHDYQCIVSATGYGCNSTTSNVVMVTANPDPTISVQPTPASDICSGTYKTLSVTVIDGISLSYRWQKSTVPVGTWTNVASGDGSGETTSAYTTANLTAPTSYRVIVTDSGNVCTPTLTSNAAIVYVRRITTQPSASNSSICVGGTTTLTAATQVGDAIVYTYQWQYDTSGAGAWADVVDNTPVGALYTNATTASMTVAGITAVATNNYRLVIQVTAPVCIALTSNTVAVTVIADPFVTTHPTDGTICNGATYGLSVVAGGGTPTINYQWEISTIDSPYSWSNVSSEGTAASYTTAALTANTWYRVKIISSGSVCNTVYSDPAKVTVNKFVTAGTIGTAQTICYNVAPIGLTNEGVATTTENGTVITYIWQKSTDGTSFSNIIPSETNNFYSPGILTANTWYRRVATSTLNGVQCSSNSNSVKVTVEPVPSATPSTSSQTICHSIVPTLSVNVMAIDGHKYLVSTVSNPDGVGGVTSAPYTCLDGAVVETGTLTNTGTANKTVTYTIQPYTNGANGIDNSGTGDDCLWTPFDVTFTVELQPTATPSAANEVICGSSAPTITVDVTALNGNKYKVSSIANTGG